MMTTDNSQLVQLSRASTTSGLVGRCTVADQRATTAQLWHHEVRLPNDVSSPDVSRAVSITYWSTLME